VRITCSKQRFIANDISEQILEFEERTFRSIPEKGATVTSEQIIALSSKAIERD